MPDVFISYARQDIAFADGRGLEKVFKSLAPEFSVWRDDRIAAGSAWSDDIATNLRQAKSVVVIWSKIAGIHHGFGRKHFTLLCAVFLSRSVLMT